MRHILFALLSLLFVLSPALADEARDQRMAWWRDAKFGMFIHWGVYAVPAGNYEGKPIPGIGEWILKNGEIPLAKYRAYAREFNPVKYDPAAWAQLAQEAGMKYIVITSKHHDGFALYDSAVTEWDIAGATPYKKDLLAPLAAAARERGLKFGLYYSQAQDWTHPGGAKAGMEDGQGWDAAHKGSFDKYLADIALPQTKEILAKFKPDVLWWDTPALMTPERAAPLAAALEVAPNIITNNRLGGGFEGDTETPEQFIPATGFKNRDWETCMTLNDTWGFKADDHNWKSPQTVIRNLVDIISKGGNYLLNVGPTKEGEIPPESIAILREVGQWMQVNGDSIYGTQASPCRAPAWGRVALKKAALKDADQLFLYVFDWPASGRITAPIKAVVSEPKLLADSSRTLTATQTDDGLVIELPGDAPDKICSVIALKVSGAVEEIPLLTRQGADGSLVLLPQEATIAGNSLKVETIGGQANLGFWTDENDTATWTCRVNAPGEFKVLAEVGVPLPSRFELMVGGETLAVSAPATGGYGEFEVVEFGKAKVAAGDCEVTLQPSGEGWNAINVRSVTLLPVSADEAR
jgi:alpha-L-fucosidase